VVSEVSRGRIAGVLALLTLAAIVVLSWALQRSPNPVPAAAPELRLYEPPPNGFTVELRLRGSAASKLLELCARFEVVRQLFAGKEPAAYHLNTELIGPVRDH
jgi:hypothetical protein